MAKDLLTPTKLARMKRTTAVGGGLYVVVNGESKSYGFRGTLGGKQLPMMLIGSIKKWIPAQARAESDRLNALLRKGIDPRKEKLTKKIQPDVLPVGRLANRYFEKEIEPKKHEHETEANRLDRIKRAQRHLDRIHHTIGKMTVADVGDADPETILTKLGVEELSVPTWWEFRRLYKRMFGMAVGLRWIPRDKNPAADEVLDAFRPAKFHKQERRKSLNYVDAPRFVANVKVYKNRGLGMADRPLATVPALLFLVYTGVRTAEVTKATWREIDWENQLWNVPSDHRKKGHTKGKVRAIPISTSMLRVLKQMKELHPGTADDDLIFPGGSRVGGLGKGVLNSFIKNTLRPKWDVLIDPHGFRGTLAAWNSSLRPSYPSSFIKAQFDHVGAYSSEDDPRQRRPSVLDTNYSHHDRPDMPDPTLGGDGDRREMTERYGAYLDSYKPQ